MSEWMLCLGILVVSAIGVALGLIVGIALLCVVILFLRRSVKDLLWKYFFHFYSSTFQRSSLSSYFFSLQETTLSYDLIDA